MDAVDRQQPLIFDDLIVATPSSPAAVPRIAPLFDFDERRFQRQPRVRKDAREIDQLMKHVEQRRLLGAQPAGQLPPAAASQPRSFFDKLNDWARTEMKAPGLGYALRFGGRPGWIVDVYLYDLGLTTIPSDAESSVIREQLAQARGDVFELGKRGTYARVTDRGDFAVPASGKPRFVCSSFSYLRGDRVDIDVESYLCLSAWNDKFVKVRMTAPKGTLSQSDTTDFVQAWIELLR